jgi:drug/metabolite transporter (DMT)-like permease
VSVLLALLSSLLWGTSDFLGGSASRRSPVVSVIGLSQLTAMLLLVPVVVLAGELDADRSYALPAVAAGLVGMVSLVAFYRALAVGTMGVVAPIASLGVAVPVVAGLVTGDSPSALQVVGIVVAVVGAVLAGGPELRAEGGLEPLLLAGVAGAGFGAVFVLIAEGAESSTAMTLLVMRMTSVAVLTAAFLLTWRRRGNGLGVPRAAAPAIVTIGVFDMAANAAYALATTRAGALLSVTAVLASLYPVVTVVLARQLHHERLRRVQGVGVVGALAGVGMLAGG